MALNIFLEPMEEKDFKEEYVFWTDYKTALPKLPDENVLYARIIAPIIQITANVPPTQQDYTSFFNSYSGRDGRFYARNRKWFGNSDSLAEIAVMHGKNPFSIKLSENGADIYFVEYDSMIVSNLVVAQRKAFDLFGLEEFEYDSIVGLWVPEIEETFSPKNFREGKIYSALKTYTILEIAMDKLRKSVNIEHGKVPFEKIVYRSVENYIELLSVRRDYEEAEKEVLEKSAKAIEDLAEKLSKRKLPIREVCIIEKLTSKLFEVYCSC